MKIKNIKLENFRSYQNYSIDFDDEINILVGKNGQGKTNLIEAIYFLSLSKSFKTNQTKQVIYFDQPFCKILSNIESTKRNKEISMVLSNDSKKIMVDGVVINKTSDYVGHINTVLFIPDDLSLIKGSPSKRRKFIDIELSKISPIYMYSISKYHYLLKQRNMYLKKTKVIDEMFLEVLENQLIKVQIDILNKRKDFIQRINKYVRYIYSSIVDSKEVINIVYDSFVDIFNETTISKEYSKSKKRDILYKQTHVGVHKDDIKILIDDQMASLYGSQGQVRTIVLAIKIALIEIIKEDIGEYPILLLDDVLSELDDYRKTMLLSILNKNIQTFITTTSIDGIDHEIVSKAKKIYINKNERGV